MSTDSAILVARRFVELVKKQIPVSQAYLFGSYAKNRAEEVSDIDIYIVSPVFGKSYWDEESLLRRLSLKVDDRIEPVAFNPEDLEDKYNQLAFEIKKYGVQI